MNIDIVARTYNFGFVPDVSGALEASEILDLDRHD